ncbi:Iron-sulfur cluster carrier protein ApbC [Planctomycetales bacterium 10988]|nr:Iron-sulfur cluster carrier protein ApbC [Planctomycetales bacterium 10988]
MSEQAPSAEQILALLSDYPDPENGRPLQANKQLRDIQVSDDRISMTLALTTFTAPLWNKVRADLIERLQNRFSNLPEISIDLVTHERVASKIGQVGLRCKSVIAVGSGKGGVGKSTVAAAVAYGLQNAGCKVGLCDVDVYGPSIPHLIGVNERPEIIEVPGPNGELVNKIQPVEHHGLKVMSMGFLVEEGQAVIWRGPMLHGAVTQFLRDTNWGELDYLIIDMPPGTGDIALTLSQLLPLTGSVVVCTPQEVALLDAVKAIAMYREVNIPVLGMVENMSYFLCPDNGKRYNIFGTGGAREKAQKLEVPFLGAVPINATICDLGDEGKIGAVYDKDIHTDYDAFENICFQLVSQIAKKRSTGTSRPSLPTL